MRLFTCLAFVLQLVWLSCALENSVDLKLVGTWSKSPFKLNLIESFGAADESTYFSLVNKLFGVSTTKNEFDEVEISFEGDDTDDDEELQGSLIKDYISDEEFYTYAKSLVEDDITRALINIDIINKINTPRIQAHYQQFEKSISNILELSTSSIGSCDRDNKVWLVDGSESFVYCQPADVFALKTTKTVPYQDILLPFDRVIGTEGPLFILYGDYRSPLTKQFYRNLYEYSIKGRLSFVWRYVNQEFDESSEVLGGYGVDLTLKRTDYIAIDDRGFTKEQQEKMKFNQDDEQNILDLASTAKTDDHEFWSEYTDDIKPLHKDEISTLGFKFTKFMEKMASMKFPSEAYQLFKTLLFDLPKFANDIATRVPTENFDQLEMKSIKLQRGGILPGILINGSPVDVSRLDIFQLLKKFKREWNFVKKVSDLGMSPSKAKDFIMQFGGNVVTSLYNIKSSNNSFERYNIQKEFPEKIIFINDLESSDYYRNFMTTREFFDSLGPQSVLDRFPPILENLNTAVFAFSFSNGMDLNTFLQAATAVIKNRIGQQIGILPMVENEIDYIIAQRFYVEHKKYGSIGALKYLIQISNNFFPNGRPVIEDMEAFKLELFNFEGGVEADPEKIDNRYLKPVREILDKFAITSPSVIVNGVFIPFDKDWRDAMFFQLRLDIVYLKSEYEAGNIPQDSSFVEYLMKGALTQRAPFLIPDVSELETSYIQKEITLESFTELTNAENSFTLQKSTKGEVLKTLTVIGNSANKVFVKQIIAALEYYNSLSTLKLRFIDFNSDSAFIEMLSAEEKLGVEKLIESFKEFSVPENNDNLADYNTSTINSIEKSLGVKPNSPNDLFILLNGRLIDTQQFQHAFSNDQFGILENYETSLRLGMVDSFIKDMELSFEIEDAFDQFEYICILIAQTCLYHENAMFGDSPIKRLPILDHENSIALTTQPSCCQDEDIVMRVDVVGDPITEELQKFVGIASVLEGIHGVKMNIHLLPQKIEEEKINIKRFYRYITSNKVQFDKETGSSLVDTQLSCIFENVPEKTLFTLDIDSPLPWIVNIKEANTDFDNVKLDLTETKSAVGVYELANILVEGHAREFERFTSAPVGISVELTDYLSGETYSDTNVMATMGYLQLKANPGFWNFRIKPNTESATIYSFIDVSTTFSPTGDQYSADMERIQSKLLAIMDLSGLTIFPVSVHMPGFEGRSMLNNRLEKEPSSSNILGKAWKMLSSKSTALSSSVKKQADINIFSVASGHLYERLLGIMSASVMKHTKHTVKFWLIDNYMSPEFRRRLPILADHFGFEYELITYKWPVWLRNQREKQRTIWGYKILFLDALFPQDLDKVIFVDSDQIVRTDMKELMDLDLEGAPYGYTPMGDSRKEMEGFRFWKQGYWKTLLGDDYKYHISALYVIDLKKFRSIAAGDLLRHHYQGLSQDPNSLSNLDQDLPNNLQHTLKIHSLPEEWLWCETWCDDASLKKAKTIDLCNNPLTKEPKLVRARRQIPEWQDYDDEIANLFKDEEVEVKAEKESTKHDEL